MRNIYITVVFLLTIVGANQFICGDSIEERPAAITNDAGAIVQGELGEKLNQYLSRMERFGMHGAIVIEYRGETILKYGYGLANEATRELITADTVFHLGSLGKQFTASAIMLLQEQGKLNVSDTIDKYLDNVPDDKKLITIHLLLTHQSGLPYQPSAGRALDLPLQFSPGERWSYSNPGYRILYEIIEKVSGESYCDFLERNFLQPLEMTNTHCTGEPYRDYANLAHAYTDETEQGTVVDFAPNDMYAGAGDFASTVGDLLKWEHAIRDHSRLSEQSLTAMFTEQARNPDSRVGYAYGWMTSTTIRGTPILMHAGNLGGFNSDYRRYPEEQLTIIFLSNHFVNGRSMRDAVMNNVSLLINGGDALSVPEATVADLSNLAGTYKLPDGATIDATSVHGGLELSGTNQDAIYMLFAPDADTELRAQCTQWSEATESLLNAIMNDDATTARGMFNPGLPFGGAWPGLRDMANSAAVEYGALRTIDVMGVAPISGGATGRSFARLVFEDGAAAVQCTWTRSGLIHITLADEPPAQRFLPTAEGNLIAFDIFSGASVTVEVKDGASANPVLVFRRGEERIEARKS